MSRGHSVGAFGAISPLSARPTARGRWDAIVDVCGMIDSAWLPNTLCRPPAIPSVSIKSITFGATTVPVALNNVFGQIDITLNLDVPTGAKVSALRTYVGNVKVCEQTFSGGAEIGATEEVNEAADVICSVNTAAYTGTVGTDAQATITFPNGQTREIELRR